MEGILGGLIVFGLMAFAIFGLLRPRTGPDPRKRRDDDRGPDGALYGDGGADCDSSSADCGDGGGGDGAEATEAGW